jgi:hypothetical protein
MTAAPAKFWHQAAGAVLARCRGPTAETRAENASQRKLDAIADALVDLMEELGGDNPSLRRSRDELTAEVGVEHRESTK